MVQRIRMAAERPKAMARRFESKGCSSEAGQGTGSNPPGWNGWQRERRRVASHAPFRRPWRRIDSRAYSEQVGWNRQAGGRRGETYLL
jgi:hypothetical protein